MDYYAYKESSPCICSQVATINIIIGHNYLLLWQLRLLVAACLCLVKAKDGMCHSG